MCPKPIDTTRATCTTRAAGRCVTDRDDEEDVLHRVRPQVCRERETALPVLRGEGNSKWNRYRVASDCVYPACRTGTTRRHSGLIQRGGMSRRVERPPWLRSMTHSWTTVRSPHRRQTPNCSKCCAILVAYPGPWRTEPERFRCVGLRDQPVARSRRWETRSRPGSRDGQPTGQHSRAAPGAGLGSPDRPMARHSRARPPAAVRRRGQRGTRAGRRHSVVPRSTTGHQAAAGWGPSSVAMSTARHAVRRASRLPPEYWALD